MEGKVAFSSLFVRLCKRLPQVSLIASRKSIPSTGWDVSLSESLKTEYEWSFNNHLTPALNTFVMTASPEDNKMFVYVCQPQVTGENVQRNP
jgi:hypothetical protein